MDKGCSECGRLMVRKVVGVDGAAWELQEEMNLFHRTCWPCGCKKNSKRHVDLLSFSANHPCGCGP